MTPFCRPFASVAVAAVLTATTLVPAQEMKKAARPERSTTTTVEVKTAGPAPLQIQEIIRVFPRGDNQVHVNNAQPVVTPQLVQSLTTMFRTILRSEYQLVLTVCEPTKEQRREIARAGERALKEAAELAAPWQLTARRVVVRNGVHQVEEISGRPDVRKILRDALAAAVKEHLSSEQAEHYRQEVEQRAAEEKQTAVRNLVEKIDSILLLSPDQRAQIADQLTTNWDESWTTSSQALDAAGADYFLPIPDPYVVPVLTRSQARIWNATTKRAYNGWVGYINGMGLEESPLEDAELGDVPKADAPAQAVKKGFTGQ